MRFSTELASVIGEADTEYKKKLLKKCEKYSVAIPALLGESYSLLRGEQMSDKERLSLTCIGGLTGLFDDLFDENKLSDEQVEEFVANKQVEGVDLPDLKLISFLYGLFEQNVRCDMELGVLMSRIVNSQMASRRQKDEHLSSDDLEKIISEKGGSAMLIYQLAFANKPDVEERVMIFHLGALGQMVNDIFDVYDDVTSGIKTLINQSDDINAYRESFEERVVSVVKELDGCGFSSENRQKFRQIILLIVSGAYLCLDNYEKLQRKTEGKFQPEKYKRSELVCDMEKLSNIIRLVQMSVVLNKKIIR